MSMIALKIPSNISEKLSKIKVDGKKELQEEYHITMFYFDGKLKIDDRVIDSSIHGRLKALYEHLTQ